MALKVVLIGPRGTVFKDGRAQTQLLNDLILFIRRMHQRGVHVGLWSQHPVTYGSAGQTESLESYVSRQCGQNVPFYRAAFGNLPVRRRAGAVDPILNQLGVGLHETVLVGNDTSDMQAGVNNKLLLIRPEWYPGAHAYGFPVTTVSELAQFCEIFGLRQHPIYWSIDQGDLQVRSMGPYSTFRPDFAVFGADARNVAKHGIGERQFWFWMMVSSLYFSGLMHQVDFICPFPGHDPSSNSAVKQGIDAVLTTLGKCFRKDYLPDLIVRHTASIKSQTARANEKTFLNQLNTLRLNRYPKHYDREPNRAPLSLRNKRLLVVDDFCTNGRSLDVARSYIEAAGGTAILFSWLKTINSSFLHMTPQPKLKPFEANHLATEPNSAEFYYSRHIVSAAAPTEIDAALAGYKNWQWP
ncbi:MAG TPA: phosphoribosyltransferase [Reyranella sp.]|nr:phosphoribosyltransferase [Reyranella sp.]